MSSSRLQWTLLSRMVCSWTSKAGFWLFMQVLKPGLALKPGNYHSFLIPFLFEDRLPSNVCSPHWHYHGIFLSEYMHRTHCSSFLVLPWCLTYHHRHETRGSNSTHIYIVFTVCSESRLWRQPTKWHSFLEAHFLVMDVLLPWLVKWWTVKQYCVSREI